jgi:hypothetical protein
MASQYRLHATLGAQFMTDSSAGRKNWPLRVSDNTNYQDIQTHERGQAFRRKKQIV